MLTTVGLLGHLGAWIGCTIFSIWLVIKHGSTRSGLMLSLALFVTGLWALVVAYTGFYGGGGVAIAPFETLSNIALTVFLSALLLGNGRPRDQAESERRAVFNFLIGLFLAQLVMDVFVRPDMYANPLGPLASVSLALRIMAAIGMLLLVHNLYLSTTPSSHFGTRLLSVAMGAIIIYDLNLYTITFLNREIPPNLMNMRGIILVLVLPILWMAARRSQGWRIQLSHSAAFQTFALAGIGLYLVFMASAVYGLRLIGGDWGRLLQIIFLFSALLLSALFLVSDRARAWTRVKIAKNFLPYKYDYRSEWLRFIRTVSTARSGYGELPERVVRAVATIIDAPGGILFSYGDDRQYAPLAHWHMAWSDAGSLSDTHPMVQRMASDGRIVNLDEYRADPALADRPPEWMLESSKAWLIVPFIHLEHLAGFVVLQRSRVVEELNWEDFDLLRTVGRQAASYIAEAQSQSTLADAEKFDEFNRRFAFIMHDIKNLVSQLSLLARNAERHADNPEFRADMVATLQSSVGKMNALLARLAQHNKGKPDEKVTVELGPVIEAVVRDKGQHHPIQYKLYDEALVVGDEQRIEQIVTHLLQNAVDASNATASVAVELRVNDGQAEIVIEDKGVGMSPAFIRDQLFKPFVSTKVNGFGIGSFESREIARSMGGSVDVWSAEGEGSRFTVRLPLADRSGSETINVRAATNGVD